MANGKQMGEQNVQAFQTWLASKSDTDFRQMVSRGVLSRTEIAKECGFAKSALDQNPRIKAALKATEDGLRERAILPTLEDKPLGDVGPLMREGGTQRALHNSQRLKRLEEENANLHAQNRELKHQLSRYVVLQTALALSGRIPR